jgi:hypothetical protein
MLRTMCLIIDSNIIDKAFSTGHADFEPVRRAILSGNARLVFGGQLLVEYKRKSEFLRFLLVLERAGKAIPFSDSLVDSETARVRRSGICRSDDPHVIALARVSGVRLLCSEDQELGDDFKDLRLLNPKGSIYKKASHAKLIFRHCRQ